MVSFCKVIKMVYADIILIHVQCVIYIYILLLLLLLIIIIIEYLNKDCVRVFLN